MAKKRFLKPARRAKKEAGGTLISSIVRDGSAIGYKVANKKLLNKLPAGVQKFVTPAMLLLAKSGEVFIEDPHVKSVCEGVGVIASMEMASKLDKNNTFGLKGIDGIGSYENQETGKATVQIDDEKPDWEKMVDEVEKEIANEDSQGVEGFDGLEGDEDYQDIEEALEGEEPDTIEAINKLQGVGLTEDQAASLLDE